MVAGSAGAGQELGTMNAPAGADAGTLQDMFSALNPDMKHKSACRQPTGQGGCPLLSAASGCRRQRPPEGRSRARVGHLCCATSGSCLPPVCKPTHN